MPVVYTFASGRTPIHSSCNASLHARECRRLYVPVHESISTPSTVIVLSASRYAQPLRQCCLHFYHFSDNPRRGAMASLASSNDTGAKRSHDGLGPEQTSVTKRRRVHHTLRDPYQRPSHVEPAPQDPVFAQGQLLRSIGAALVMAGFDSVKPSAMEMFRSHVEECT